MTDLAKDFASKLADLRNPKAEFELYYVDRYPPSSAFAYDLLHFDREVRRAARETREKISRGPIEARRHLRPLGVSHGLIVDESHRSQYSFLLEIPADLYKLILSNPVDFAIRVFELSGVFLAAERRLSLRRRTSDNEETEEESIDVPPEQQDENLQAVPDKGACGGTFERIERFRFPDGTIYEIVERVER